MGNACCVRREHDEMVISYMENGMGRVYEPFLLNRNRSTGSIGSMRRRSSNLSILNRKAIETSFPPLVERPGWRFCTIMLVIGISLGLCLTVFEEWLAKHGLPTDVFLGYASIPAVSVVFTYVHIWAALYMTFYPLHYLGCLQIPETNTGCGWQGIIPSKAEKMARTSVRLMTENLIKVQDIVERIDAQEVYRELQPVLDEQLFKTVQDAAMKADPALWNTIPGPAKSQLLERANKDSKDVVASIVKDMRTNIDQLFDLEEMVVTTFVKQPELLNHMFISCGYNELVFIRDCGAWMGGAFGIVQVIIWNFYTKGWMLPAFGFAAGVFTNWIALKMIFEPIDPVPCCGLEIQGLFLKRQKEVAAVYAEIVSENVLYAKNIIRAILRGKLSNNLFEILLKHVDVASERSLGGAKHVASLLRSQHELNKVKFQVAEEAIRKLPDTMKHVENYIDKSMELEGLLYQKLSELSPQRFENLLHPVFQEDEWKLVLMGGVLGVVIGMGQWHFLGN